MRTSSGILVLFAILQAPGEHTAVLRVKQLPQGLSYYLGQVLVIGSLRP